MNQFGRIVKVTVYGQRAPGLVANNPGFFEDLGNGVEITEARVQFKIEKHLDSDPNKAEVTITNLSEHTRAEFQRRPLRVRLEAGYEGALRLLFIGDVQPGSGSELVGADWETKLLLGDGFRAFSSARVNRSYVRGTQMKTILRDVARSLGLETPRDLDADPALATALASGDAITGWASDEMTRLLAPYAYTWSIQNGRLQILRDEQVRTDTIRVLEGGENGTGMIDSPVIGTPDKSGKPPTITVAHLLYPELLPGGEVQIRSQTTGAGRYKIINVTHTGDTAGDEWTTEVEGRPI